MALNQYGYDDALMVPDWAQESPVQQIPAPHGGLDALGNIGQPTMPEIPTEDVTVLGPDGKPVNGPVVDEGHATPPHDATDVAPSPEAPITPLGAPAVGDATPAGAPPRTEFTPTPPAEAGATPVIPKNAGVTKMNVTQNIASPESQAASKDAAGIAEKQIEVERRLSEERQKNLAAEQKAADQQQAATLEKQQRMNELLQEHKQRLADLTAKDDAARAAMQGGKIHDYWEDKSTGDRVLAALSVFLGGLGTAYGGENTAMKTLQTTIQRDYDRQREELQRKRDYQAITSKDKDAAQTMLNNEMHNLDLKQVAATDATAAQLVQMKTRQGIPLEQAQSDKDVLAIQKLANDKRAEIAEKQDAKVTQETTAKARGILGGGAGGGGNAAAIKLVKMAEDGAKRSDIVAAAAAAGLPEKVWKNQVDLAFKEREGAAAAKDAAESKRAAALEPRTVVVDGQPIGLVASSRQTKAFADRYVQYNDAIQSLEALKARVARDPITGRLPTGADYERAVSAIAGTTTANSSDSMTAHEAGSIKNMGLVDPKAIETSLEHLRHRQKAFLSTLQPLPGEDGSPAERAQGGEAKAPKADAAPKAEPTRQQKAAAATRIIQDPNAPPAVKKRAKEFLQSLGG